MSITQCYAAIEVSALESKELFYQQLTVLTNVNRSDIIVLIGDFHAKVGRRGNEAECRQPRIETSQ